MSINMAEYEIYYTNSHTSGKQSNVLASTSAFGAAFLHLLQTLKKYWAVSSTIQLFCSSGNYYTEILSVLWKLQRFNVKTIWQISIRTTSRRTF